MFEKVNPAHPDKVADRIAGALVDLAYFAATYEYLEDEETHDCESTIGLRAVSEVEFEDDGHAMAWAMQQ